MWLGILALTASAFEQNQLGLTVLTAAGVTARTAFSVPPDHHLMPDGTLMVGAMHGAAAVPFRPVHDASDELPSDCDACVTIAAMGAFTLPAIVAVFIPRPIAEDRGAQATAFLVTLFAHPAYASRAPPRQHA